MKKLAIVFIGLFLMVLSVDVFAQYDESATANSTANIVNPITIQKDVDLAFGNIIASASAGTVTVDFANGRSLTGGVSFPTVGGTVTSAEFTATGLTGAVYSITLPADNAVVLLGPGGVGVDEMPITNFQHNATENLTGGSETFQVGATLNVEADETAGAYSTTFDVIVNYN